MTPEQLEGNKLIAEFMGYEQNAFTESMFSKVEDVFVDNKGGRCSARWTPVYYHESWDWLMPVVEKISRIEFERRYDEYQEKWIIWTHHPITFGMLDDNRKPMVRFYCSTLNLGDTLIQAAWNAVVDFVKQHQEVPTI
jgi:hypothetical protein